MSDASQGPGWWLASDGRWYPPDLAPGPIAQAPPPQAPFGGPAPTYGAPTAAAPGYPAPSAYPPYAYVPMPRTNGLAVFSFVSSFFFWLYGLGAVLAIVLGFVARAQIKRSGGTQRGAGLALAGIIIGFVGLVLGVVIVVLVVSFFHRHCHGNGDCTFNTTFNNGT